MGAQGDVYRVAVRMGGAKDQDIMNIWHIQLTNLVSGVDDDIVDDILERVSYAYQDLEPALSNDQYDKDISIQNVTTGQVHGSHLWQTPFVGTTGGDSLPPQSSLFSYFRTGFPRRIGRKFWGLMAELSQDQGLAASAVAVTMATFLAHFIITFVGITTGNTYAWGVYNENMSPQFAPFREAVGSGRLMTQRRRRPTVGS